jgi:hypothetical protein
MSSVEVLPKVEANPWKARGWFMGVVPMKFADFSLDEWKSARRAIAL